MVLAEGVGAEADGAQDKRDGFYMLGLDHNACAIPVRAGDDHPYCLAVETDRFAVIRHMQGHIDGLAKGEFGVHDKADAVARNVKGMRRYIPVIIPDTADGYAYLEPGMLSFIADEH